MKLFIFVFCLCLYLTVPACSNRQRNPTQILSGNDALKSVTVSLLNIPQSSIKSLHVIEHRSMFDLTAMIIFDAERKWVDNFLHTSIEYENKESSIFLGSQYSATKDDCEKLNYAYIKYPHQAFQGKTVSADKKYTFHYLIFFCRKNRSVVIQIHSLEKLASH